ncbi:MAG: hypothetical protein ACTSRS_12865 [Candidatus Helarchaeota archaeon]
MAKSTSTIVFGVIQLSATVLLWIFLYLPYSYYTAYPLYSTRLIISLPAGPYILFSTLLFTVSAILFTVFFASDLYYTPGKVAYWFNFAGWSYFLVFCPSNLPFASFPPANSLSGILYMLIFVFAGINAIFGILLFARANQMD